MLLKTTFKIPLFVIKDPGEQTAAFHVKMVYVFPAWSINVVFKKSYMLLVIFVASSLFLFFNLFSKYVLKLLETFLASSKAG